MSKLPLLVNLTSLKIHLAVSLPNAPEAELLLKKLPGSVSKLHVELTTSSSQQGAGHPAAERDLPVLQGFASLIQLEELNLDVSEVIKSLQSFPGHADRVQRDILLHGQTIRTLVTQVTVP
jgi:hypothetical protein